MFRKRGQPSESGTSVWGLARWAEEEFLRPKCGEAPLPRSSFRASHHRYDFRVVAVINQAGRGRGSQIERAAPGVENDTGHRAGSIRGMERRDTFLPRPPLTVISSNSRHSLPFGPSLCFRVMPFKFGVWVCVRTDEIQAESSVDLFDVGRVGNVEKDIGKENS